MQMLQKEILALKENPTDANVKQIEEKEKDIAEKKNALKKHCHHLGMTYGEYGAQENGNKPENTTGEVSIALPCLDTDTDISSQQTGAMTNGYVKDVHASADVKMHEYSTTIPTGPADAASSAALDEIQFPQLTSVNIPNSSDDNGDPFVTPGGYATIDMFHAPTGTYVDPYGAPAGNYTYGFTNNDRFINQSMTRTDSTGKPVIDVDKYLMETDGVMPANYGTSAGRIDDHGMSLGRDYEMDMDVMVPHAPVTEHDETIISGMDK